ncbi:DUF885 domain-containing protein [Massilia terrae]|uniref:DUF885 domain-containing protein n=1 Tax=Massilia terrae TaxID=1811224 RepID=A0ABT2CSG4_9BURK|nr:DUF885 domain-containing protein [Massilia terrae]MCS0656911.1 DUF885 domain-containing protein [Massilia terrae]
MQTIHPRAMRIAVAAALSIPLLIGTTLPNAAHAAPAAAVSAVKENAAFNTWAETFAQDWVRQNPQMATSTQYFEGAEQNALDRQLTPLTDARRKQMIALAKKGIAQLDKYMAGPLSEDQRISAATMRWSLSKTVEGEPFEGYNFVFSQHGGVQVGLVNFMTQTHPIRNANDVANYLARLEQVSTRIDEALVRARRDAARKLIPPRVILERAQYQVDKFLEPAAAQNVLVTSLDKRSAALKDLSPEARADAIAKATHIVQEKVIPAYGRVKAFMVELYPRTGNVVGISRLPDGAAAYAHYLSNFTSTKLSAEEIHAIGLREVARIEGEMDKHLRELGLAEGSVAERMKQLDERFQPKTEGDPRPELLARYADYVTDAQVRSKAIFNLMPRAPVDVRREPPITEASASAHYSLPAPDGSRPGTFWVPLRGPKFDMIRMRSLAYHEAVPGHHFQLAIQQEQTGLPKYRANRIFGGGSAHSEGWGLYAERLAVEQGWYKDDVPGLLGALGSELFRARRLVVDTGMHAKGWTREQSIDYGINKEEIERYIAWPGQANAYMVGMLRILELREKAKNELGPKFSLPAFHDVVLRTGSVPLDVLGEVVDRWIAQQKKI